MDLTDLPTVPVCHRTAPDHGLSPDRLRRAVRRGLLRPILRGVYLRYDLCLTTAVKLQAAALVINASSVACDRTAAWIWGVDVFEFRELDDVPPVETYVLRGRRRACREGVRGGSRDLLDTDWVEVEGVKVTTPLRTAMDLGCLLPRPQALAAMDALMRGDGFGREDMSRLLPRYFRRRGVIQLRELVPLADGRAESPRESWTRLELLDNGLPAPELQWWIQVDGVPTYRLDLAYPHAKIAIEYDGEEFHSSPLDRERDESRRQWLRDHGWVVIVVRSNDLTGQSDHWWVAEVAQALREAQRRVRRHYPR